MLKKLSAGIFCLFFVTMTWATAPTEPANAATTSSTGVDNNPAALAPLPDVPQPNARNTPVLVPPPPTLNAKAYILIDANTGDVIAEKNADEKMPPASLTKLMTMYVVSNALKNGQINLSDEVRISKDAWQTGGSRMFVKEGQRVPVEDLIKGIIVDSGNDACVAMSEYVGGTQDAFVTLMDQAAKNLGMNNTHYTDATGLPHPDHYSTARDISILARAIIQDYPQDYHYYKIKWLTFNGIKQPNRNRLLWRDPSVDGMKTGHTKEAGFCLVASAQRNDMRLISVVMGTPSDSARMDDSQRLLNFGYRFFNTVKLYDANQSINTARVWGGKDKDVAAGVMQPLYVTIPRGQYKNLKATVTLNNPIKAPVAQGEALGTINVVLNGKTIKIAPVVALKNDPKGGHWARMSDSMKLSVHHWMGKDKKAS